MIYRGLLTAMLAMVLAGCDVITAPPLVDVRFDDEYVATATGCELRLHAQGINGTSEWGRVQLYTVDELILDLSGAEFWGSTTIGPNERQTSIAVALERGRVDYLFDAFFTTPNEQVLLRFPPACPPV
jgi:hypothetical protein